MVNKAGTSATVASSVNPSVFGQGVTFTATVTVNTPGSTAVADPTGTVTFYDNGVQIGTGTLSGAATDTATFTTSTLSTASHPITAAYTSGDGNFNASAASTAISQVVNKADTSTALSSSVNPSVSGQGVTFTATVAIVSPGTNAVANPTGTVNFYDGTTLLGSGALSGNATDAATFTTSALATSSGTVSHSITATYADDANFNPSTSTALTQTVSKASTSTAVSSSGATVSGQAVTFTATVTIVSPGTNAVADPTGTVNFYDGTTLLGGGALSGAGTDTAIFTTSTLSPASHSVTAKYADDTNFNPSTSAAITQTVSKADTATSVASSSATVSGQAVTFTATVAIVSPGTGAVANPTGTVDFYDGTTLLGSGTLSGTATDTATFSTSTLSTADHQITATYADDVNFNPSTSAAITQTVSKASTATSVASSGSTVSGQAVTFTATVSIVSPGTNAVANPTGAVNFYDGTTLLGSGSLSGTATDTASFTTSVLSTGSHTITATYADDTNFNPSTSGAITQTVSKASTATSVASSGATVSGQAVTFTATVTIVSPGTNAVADPTGTVNFYDGTTLLGGGALSGAGTDTATFSTSTLSTASHSVTAKYADDTNFNPSTSAAITQTASKADTATSVASSGATVSGQAVTFTATVAIVSPGANAVANPTGTVDFYDGATQIGTGTLSGTATDQASFTTSILSTGSHSITATYADDTNFNPSTSGAIAQTVSKADTATSVASSGATVSGQAVTFTATVSIVSPGSSAVANPTGTVNFYDGTTLLGSGTLSGTATDTATFSTSTLSTGGHSITAQYADDTNFNPSTSSAITQTVSKASTATSVASSGATVSGQAVTFTATVAIVSPGTNAVANPTGAVNFYDGSTEIGTGTLNGANTDQATFTTSVLSTGSHSITATYADDANFNPSTSGAITQTVSKADTTTSVASSGAKVSGQAVTFTATVSIVSPGTGAVANPTGTVDFYDGTTLLGSGTLSGSGDRHGHLLHQHALHR